MNFNLLEKPWLPVLYSNGNCKRINLCEAFQNASQIRDIACPNPMDRFAVIRFLITIFYWANGIPDNTATSCPLSTDRMLENCVVKLNEHKEHFNLLGNKKRFYQETGLQRRCPIADLIQEIPTGHNFNHFFHVHDYQHGICLSCCALGLLRTPVFMLSGTPDLRAGINGAPPIYAIRHENTLSQTLVKNRFHWEGEIGKPIWIDNVVLKQNQAIPLLTGLSVPARRVYLDDTDTMHGKCLRCGIDSSILLKQCLYESAGSFRDLNWADPHVLKPINEKPLMASDSIKFLKTDRYCSQLFKCLGENVDRGTYLVVGLASNNAKYVDVWERSITIENPETTVPPFAKWSEKIKEIENAAPNRLQSIELRTDKQKKCRKHMLSISQSLAYEILPEMDIRFIENPTDENAMFIVDQAISLIVQSISTASMTDNMRIQTNQVFRKGGAQKES